MAAPPIVCWGELLWDVFPDGRRLGGAAANVAYHLARLGRAVVLVSRVGDDEPGHAALAQLETAGVDASQLQLDAESPTGSVRVELVDGEPHYRIASSVAWDRIDYPPTLRELVRAAPALYYGTLAQRTPLGSASLKAALTDAPPACLRVCDLNVRKPFATPAVIDAAVAAASVVKLNESEAALIAEQYSAPDPIGYLLDQGVALVAATRGARGAILASRQERAEHAGFPVDASAGDRVGAGDAFVAMLIHQLLRGAQAARAVELANRYASHVASQPGAMPEVPVELTSL